MTLELVAFDIETTGFTITDEVTVVGFALPLGVRVFVQTRGRPADGVEAHVQERVDSHMRVSTHPSEHELLEAVGAFTAERFSDDDVLLVAYNGETWQSGFDLPFLRTRLADCDVQWPFNDLPYADLMPIVTKRFNTTLDEEVTAQDLVGVYDALCEGDADASIDPFEDSEEAVTAFTDDRFGEVVLHNVADIVRTRALGRLAERYCSKSDFKLKSLTPTAKADK